MKVLILVACLVVVASAKSLTGKNADFESFKRKFGKTYKTAIEEDFRLKIFLNHQKTIAAHNKLHQAGKVSFSLGVNQFADLTTKEFSEVFNGVRRPAVYKPKNLYKPSAKAAPDSIDWRDAGYVTPIKDQGQCGSCWSFSAAASLEGQHFASTGNLVSLSEQNLMDCSWDYGNEGCNGGWMDQAFDYIIDNDGVDTEASYPYEERDGVCRYDAANKGATANGYVDIPAGDEDALKESCGTVGPIAVAIDASHESFQLYNGGVYYEALCFQNVLDHGVTVVGYGNEGGEDYWLVKNSWGTSWGEAGYIKMSRNRNNNCGIASVASYPTV